MEQVFNPWTLSPKASREFAAHSQSLADSYSAALTQFTDTQNPTFKWESSLSTLPNESNGLKIRVSVG